MITFDREPGTYRHWRLAFDGNIATLTLDVSEDAGIDEGYKLKLNSYDLGVDIELRDALDLPIDPLDTKQSALLAPFAAL